ncbi:MAG: NADH-quinone oxidoreductase subunit NuoH [Desulfurococcales archaeon]|nr:NADH-quinone oxidoreductase subunit NuoH [Desulfurococcales archaeon]
MTGWVEAIIKIIEWPPLWQLVVLGLIAPLAVVIYILWFERKTAARVQRRIGPYHVSPRIAGGLQLLADLIRYSFQEVIIPKTVDKAAFISAPLIALILSILPVVAIPFTDVPKWFPLPMDYSLILALALVTLSPLFIIVAGWASNNKFAIIGGMREAYLIVSYEIIAILSFLAATAMTGTYNLVDIVHAQTGWKWFIVLNPLAFFTAFVGVLLSTSGFPFEIAESEHEVVAGAFTEYSGLMYGINMGAAYLKRMIYSLLLTVVFLGGWYPLKPGEGFIWGYLAPSIVIFIKATILMMIFSFFRAVYGRYRLDQAIEIAWKILFPLTVIAFGLGLLEAYYGII